MRSQPIRVDTSSSSSIDTATPMGFGLLNYRWVFSAGRFLESAAASGTSNPQPGGPVIRKFQLPPQGVPHAWNDASEPQQRKVELWARNCWEFFRKRRLPSHFWVLLHAVNLRHGTDGFTSPPKEGMLRIFSPEKSDAFGRVWTRELGYQRPARLPLVGSIHVAANERQDTLLSRKILCVTLCVSISVSYETQQDITHKIRISNWTQTERGETIWNSQDIYLWNTFSYLYRLGNSYKCRLENMV